MLVKPKCVFEVNFCFDFAAVCLQFSKERHASKTHIGCINMESKMHIRSVMSSWKVKNGSATSYSFLNSPFMISKLDSNELPGLITNAFVLPICLSIFSSLKSNEIEAILCTSYKEVPFKSLVASIQSIL